MFGWYTIEERKFIIWKDKVFLYSIEMILLMIRLSIFGDVAISDQKGITICYSDISSYLVDSKYAIATRYVNI